MLGRVEYALAGCLTFIYDIIKGPEKSGFKSMLNGTLTDCTHI